MRRFGLVVVATAFLLAAAVASAGANGVSIKAKPTTMVYGVGGTISGGLTTPGTVTKFVLLQSTYPFNSSNFKPIAEQSNSSTAFGKYSFKVKPTATARYRVDAKGPLVASSDPLKVFVKRQLFFRAGRITVASARFSGRVFPNQAVWVYLQRRFYWGGESFHNYRRIRANPGTFAATFAKTVPASCCYDYRVRIFESAGDIRRFVTATSQVITL
jgi:hypothetical protein